MKKSVKIGIIWAIIVAIIAGIIIVAVNIINTKDENIEKGNTSNKGISSNKKMNMDNINLITSSDEEAVKVPVPKGYTASSVKSERTVKGGFVIYEGEEEVTEANLEKAKRTRNQYVWIPIEDASDMYWTDEETKNIYGAIYNFSSEGYTREIKIKSEPVADDKLYVEKYMNGMTGNELQKEMQQSFTEMIKSVETYGGFYIGRYETGDLSKDIPVSVKMNEDISNQNWYSMYTKMKKMSRTNKNIETGMIWGIQCDETLKWLIDTGNKTYEDIATNSTSWGNYKDATFVYTNTSEVISTKPTKSETRIPTGSSEYTVANNIYDLAGNVAEWTKEKKENRAYSRVLLRWILQS